MKKSPWKSKTLWFNVIAAVLITVNSVFTDNQLIPTEVAGFVTVAVNFILRFLTKTSVTGG